MTKVRYTLAPPHCARMRTVDAILVGGGQAGVNILQIFEMYDWLHLCGVVDQDEHAPGVQLAHTLCVPTFVSVTDALQQFDGEMVIDATGDAQVSAEIEHYCSHMGKDYISGTSAKLLFSLAHTHIEEKHEIQEKNLRLEMLKTMLHIYETLGETPENLNVINNGISGSAKLVVSNKAVALECDEDITKVLGGFGIDNLPQSLPYNLVEDLVSVLLKDDGSPVVELEDPIQLTGIEGDFRLAIPLFIDGNLRYLLLHQLRAPLSDAHRNELTILASHLQRALQTENRQRILLEMANRDPLTGIYNLRYFKDRLTQELNRFQRFANGQLAVMYIEVENFDHLEKQYGSAETDKTIKDLANALYNSLRSYDVLARSQGAQFLALLPSIKNGQADNVTQRVKKLTSELRTANRSSEVYQQLSIHIGMTVTDPSTETTPDEMIAEAHRAAVKN